jgi:hypothetical protein
VRRDQLKNLGREKDNIKMRLKETGWQGEEWIYLTEVRTEVLKLL